MSLKSTTTKRRIHSSETDIDSEGIKEHDESGKSSAEEGTDRTSGVVSSGVDMRSSLSAHEESTGERSEQDALNLAETETANSAVSDYDEGSASSSDETRTAADTDLISMLTQTSAEFESSRKRESVWWLVGKLCLALGCLYFFIVGLTLLGSAFKLFGSDAAQTMLREVSNPVAGLMVGILATVFVQSSSTSTSMVVALVAAGTLTLSAAIPIIMGANIGTTVTNALVSFGHIACEEEFARAFAGAMIHDFYNLLCVVLLLPVEVLFHYLEKLSKLAADSVTQGGSSFTSPLSVIVDPVAELFVSLNKTAIEKNESDNFIKGGMFKNADMEAWAVGIFVLVISLVMLVGGLIALVKLLRSLLTERVQRWVAKVMTGPMSRHWWFGYISLFLGCGLTVMVQSSTIVTSSFTPLVGVGIVTLEQMFPVTLGANVGTTFTAMLAAVASGKSDGIAIAFAHFFFNLTGILIWYPVPQLRAVPIWFAFHLAQAASHRKWVAPLYVGVMFLGLPVLIWVLSLAPGAIFFTAFAGILFLLMLFVAWAVLRVRRPTWLPRTYAWRCIGPTLEYLFEELFGPPKDAEESAEASVSSDSHSLTAVTPAIKQLSVSRSAEV